MEHEPAGKDLCQELLSHYDSIRGFIARKIACPHATEELVQETYHRALRYGRDRTGSPRNRAWLRTIAQHLVCDHFEDCAMRTAQELLEDLSSSREGPGDHDGGLDLLGFAREDLANAMEALRPEARALILAFYFKGRDTGEIAEALGIRRAEVRVRLYRARRRLRKYLINPREVRDG